MSVDAAVAPPNVTRAASVYEVPADQVVAAEAAPVPVPAPVTVDAVELVVPAIVRSATIKPPQNLPQVLTVCGTALQLFGNRVIGPTTILFLLNDVISAVDQVSNLTSEQKKVLALESVHWLIDTQKNLSDNEKNILDMMSETVFPQAIQLLASGQSVREQMGEHADTCFEFLSSKYLQCLGKCARKEEAVPVASVAAAVPAVQPVHNPPQ